MYPGRGVPRTTGRLHNPPLQVSVLGWLGSQAETCRDSRRDRSAVPNLTPNPETLNGKHRGSFFQVGLSERGCNEMYEAPPPPPDALVGDGYATGFLFSVCFGEGES